MSHPVACTLSDFSGQTKELLLFQLKLNKYIIFNLDSLYMLLPYNQHANERAHIFSLIVLDLTSNSKSTRSCSDVSCDCVSWPSPSTSNDEVIDSIKPLQRCILTPGWNDMSISPQWIRPSAPKLMGDVMWFESHVHARNIYHISLRFRLVSVNANWLYMNIQLHFTPTSPFVFSQHWPQHTEHLRHHVGSREITSVQSWRWESTWNARSYDRLEQGIITCPSAVCSQRSTSPLLPSFQPVFSFQNYQIQPWKLCYSALVRKNYVKLEKKAK